MLLDTPPDLQLDIYPNLVVLTRRLQGGGWRSYPVDPAAVAQTLGKLPQSAGLLPPNTLTTGLIGGLPFYVVYLPPRQVCLTIAIGVDEAPYTIMTPPLVWGGCQHAYRIYALNQDGHPTDPSLPLCHAPFPNVYEDGGICWGDADARPEAAPGTLEAALQLFLRGSRFSFHVAGKKSRRWAANIVAHYADLLPDETYPLDDLIPMGQPLDWLLSGEAWRGAR